MGDKGEEGVKNIQKWVTLFMDGPESETRIFHVKLKSCFLLFLHNKKCNCLHFQTKFPHLYEQIMIFRRTQLHQMLGDDDEVDEHLEGPVVVQGIDQIQLSMKSEGKLQNSEKKA